MQKKKLALLGSTGSIGTQTLDVCDKTGEFEITALTAHKNIKKAEEQIRKYKPRYACMTDEKSAADLKILIADTPTHILAGENGACECAALTENDIVLAAIVGIAGLKPTMAAVKSGKKIALANKEAMVTAGDIVKTEAKRSGAHILPVDSEHSAIFQCISNQRKFLKKIIITASGGPFFGKKRAELENVTIEQALRHPNWSMGAKITIDSATLVNKGLEIMEAMQLFDIDVDSIEPVIHRESIIHSMVEFCDGSVIAQLGAPDMRLPIEYALTYPERKIAVSSPLNLTEIGKLTFFEPDNEAFPAIELAKRAARAGGVACAVYNGANEKAVDMFLNGKCKFTEITEIIERAVNSAPRIENPTLDDIFEADAYARSTEVM